jgi:4-amino-4-deoxy-L-arabinose transferase-like glycosyltransferase
MSTSQAPAETKPAAAPSPRARRGWRAALRPPPALAALLALTLLLGVAWSFVTPAFQAPDENAHFAYVQLLDERFELPGKENLPPASTEQALAATDSNADQAAATASTKMEWSAAAYDRWRIEDRGLPRGDGGGLVPTYINPPAYYLYEVPAYALGAHADLFTRLQLARIASVLWMLVTVAAVWALAGELLGRNRLLQLVAAGVAALAPMAQFVSASVTPDAMLIALWSVVFWLGARALKRGLTPWGAATLFAVVGLACTVKATSYALLPGVLLVLAIVIARTWRGQVSQRATLIGAAVGGLVLTLGAWIVAARALGRPAASQVASSTQDTHLNVRELLSYAWQFYLPRLPFQTTFPLPSGGRPVYEIWLKGAWGAFAWLEVRFPSMLYRALAVITALVSCAGLVSLWRRRRSADFALLGFFALVGVCLLAGLHWTEYRQLTGQLGPFAQGRYLLPLVGLVGLLVAHLVSLMRARARPAGVALVLSGMFALNVYAMTLMVVRFYA